jgi:hypothetical protein
VTSLLAAAAIDPRTRILTVVGSLALLVFVIELVRRRRLKEEYSVLWTITALTLLVLAVWFDLLLDITKVIGAVLPSSTLFFFGLIFALALLLHFSIRISHLERSLTALVQELGLMSLERDTLRRELTERSETRDPSTTPPA